MAPSSQELEPPENPGRFSPGLDEAEFETPEEILAYEFGGGRIGEGQGSTPQRSELKQLLRRQHPAFAEISDERLGRIIAVTENNVRALSRYTPSHYEGDLILMIASADGEAPSPELWRPHVSGRILTHRIPCGHGEMTQPHAIVAIGEALSRHIV